MFTRSPKLILSLTTYGQRAATVHIAIKSLLEQSASFDKLLLWLDEAEFSKNNLPESLSNISDKRFEVCFCSNYKSYKKLVPSLKKYPKATIVSFDDDCIYPKHLLKDLLAHSELHPTKTISSRGRIIRIKNSDYEPYASWQFIRNDEALTSKKAILPLGYAGILYPPGSLHEHTTNSELFLKLAPHADDLWFKCMALLKGTETAVLPLSCSNQMVLIDGTQENALYTTANADDNNTKQMRAITAYFPELSDLLQDKSSFDLFSINGQYLIKLLEANIASNKAPPGLIETLRDSAILLEKLDVNKSLTLMKEAHKYRPDGPLIKSKLAEYKAILKKS